jgi:hypothetical protein
MCAKVKPFTNRYYFLTKPYSHIRKKPTAMIGFFKIISKTAKTKLPLF